MKRRPNEETPYHRRYGLIYRPGRLGNPPTPSRRAILSPDSGEDAPLSPRGRVIFRSVLLGIFVVFCALMILTARGY